VVNVDVLADTEFRDQAVRALDDFTHDRGCPVGRTQIEGLRQIASNQPGKVLVFVDRQRKKAERRQQVSDKSGQLGVEIAFWDLIVRLCGSINTPKDQWSLYWLAEDRSPADCRPGKRPHPSAPPEERRAYNAAKEKSGSWHKRRLSEDYPAFFQRFCAHYLYLLSKQKAGEGRNDL